MAVLRGYEPLQACVNAGGDLRVSGPGRECVRLAATDCCDEIVPMFELKDGSLASSESRMAGPISIRAGVRANSANSSLSPPRSAWMPMR